MHDRFKFRCWDEQLKRYVYFSIFGTDCGFTITRENIGVNLNVEKVEQCTGLKDKNDELIYEGDIVDVNGIKYSLVWDVDECGFTLHLIGTPEYHGIYCNDKQAFEIIGNIHENPELLGEQE